MIYRIAIFLTACILTYDIQAQTAEKYFKPVKYRNIGPFRGGRSVAASGVMGDPTTYYMGTTGGGMWKTTDAGQRWESISDSVFTTGSVGAVAVSESHPYILYVGMGEHAPRGVMTSYGDGVYKSSDAGKTWRKLGLEKTQHISRIQIHPTNPDIVYVAAQGALYGPNKERGVYKSTDGGKSWNKILFINDSTGCSELAMDMNHPNTLYAGMWQHQRTPWKIISGGKGSGLFKSVDGGETWFKIEKGLPKEKGKIGVSVSRDNSEKVYALVEGDSEKDKGGLFVSNDAGKNWSLASGDNRLTQRSWYYTEVFADPKNENTVYVLSAPALRSIDGGNTWEKLTGTHGDFHDLWINPANPKNMVIANDGGAAITFDRGDSWSRQDNMPTAQIYRINADNLFPYNIYGGQQDNSSIKIANLSLQSSGITDQDWEPSAGGESAFLAFDPDDPRYVMGGSYLGTIELMDMKSKSATKIMAAPIQYLGKAARDMKYLYNWNAPVIWSKHEPGTFYHCAQVVLRTRDRGVTWEEVSPDLTRNIDAKQGKGGGPLTNEAVGAENYGTISYIVESPHEKGVFYTGSDDGQVYLTKDNMENWSNITPRDLGESLVNSIEVSPHDPAVAYIATTKYKFNDYTPAIYKTTNYGKSWTNISAGIPYGSFTRVVREDKRRKDLLYAGTEKGVYISWDGGTNWESFQLNLPTVPITDLMVHKNDLIVATSGRSFWVLDDLALISQYNQDQKPILYKPEDAANAFWGSDLNENSKTFDGTGTFAGVNPANGVVLYYDLPKDSLELNMEILDENGNLIRTFSSKEDKSYEEYDGGPPEPLTLPNKKGLNRFVWDMRNPVLPGVPGVYIEGSYKGHRVLPGPYTFRLVLDGDTVRTNARVVDNPLLSLPKKQVLRYHEIMSEMEESFRDMHQTVNRLYAVQQQLKTLIKGLDNYSIKVEGEALIQALTEWDKEMVQRKTKAYDDVENFPNKFTADYLFLMNQTESSIPRVNEANLKLKEEMDEQWSNYKKQAENWLNNEIPAYNEKLWSAGIGAIKY